MADQNDSQNNSLLGSILSNPMLMASSSKGPPSGPQNELAALYANNLMKQGAEKPSALPSVMPKPWQGVAGALQQGIDKAVPNFMAGRILGNMMARNQNPSGMPGAVPPMGAAAGLRPPGLGMTGAPAPTGVPPTPGFNPGVPMSMPPSSPMFSPPPMLGGGN